MAISPGPSFNKLAVCISFLTISSFLIGHAQSVAPEDCGAEAGSCVDKSKAQPLKIIAIFSILLTSVIGVSAPLFTKAFPALQPDRELFVIVKAFASGIILATGFLHVLPDSFDMLSSNCLPESPWHEFSFMGFVAMLSAIVTLMVDSFATSILGKKNHVAGGALVHHDEVGASPEPDREMATRGGEEVTDSQQQLRYRVVAMVEMEDEVIIFLMKRGADTPITLVTRMEKMAMIFNGRAFDLSMHEPASAPQSSGATDYAWRMRKEEMVRKEEMQTASLLKEGPGEITIVTLLLFLCLISQALSFC